MNTTDVTKMLEMLLSTNQTTVPFLQGPPGIGKSQIVRQVADRLGFIHYLDIRLSQHDATDLKGIPEKTNDETLKWVPPEFMPLEGSKWDDGQKGILFFDELNRAPVEVLQSVFEIVHDRRIGMQPILDNWYIVAAGNYGYEDGTDVVEMDSALRNRFLMVDIEAPTFGEWQQWAESAGVNPIVVDFLSEKSDLLYHRGYQGSNELITPRTWEKLSNVLNTNPGKELETAKLVAPSFLFSIAPQFIGHVETASTVKARDVLFRYDEVKDDINGMDRHEILELQDKVTQYVKEASIEDIQGFSKFFQNHLSEDNQVSLILTLYKSDGGKSLVERFLKANPDINVNNPTLFEKVQEAFQNG